MIVGLVTFVVAASLGAVAMGPFGAVALSFLAWAVLLIAVRVGIPGRSLPPTGSPPDHRLKGYPTFRAVQSQLWSATSSKRLYDHALRPRLARQAGLLLWARVGIDPEVTPDRARSLLGPDAWALIDTRIPASYDDNLPGPSFGELTDLARRLGEL